MQEKSTNNSIPWDEVERIFRNVWTIKAAVIPQVQIKQIESIIESGEPFEIQKIKGGSHSWDQATMKATGEILKAIATYVLPFVIAYWQNKNSVKTKEELKAYFSSLTGKEKDILTQNSDKLHDTIYKDKEE